MTPQRSKEIGIIVFVVLYSAMLFGLTSLFVYQDRIAMVPVLIFLGILAVVWAACMAIALATVQQPGSSSWLIFGTAIVLASAGLVQLPALAAALLLAIFLGLARRSIYREINNRVLYHASEVFGIGLRPLLFGVAFAALGLTWSVVQRIIPALPSHLTAFIDIDQLTALVTTRWVFLAIVILIAISAWRALVPILSWIILPIISGLIYLARRANLVYISRSQATIERLHL